MTTDIEKLQNRIARLQKENAKLRCELTAYGWAGSATIRKEKIIENVLDYYCMTISDIIKRDRKREVISARFILCHMLYRDARLSLNEIGKIIGGRDHTTVLHAIRETDNRIKQDYGHPEYQDYYSIKKNIQNEAIKGAVVHQQF